MWREIGGREAGKIRPNKFSNRIKRIRIQSLQLSNHKEFLSAHRGALNSLHLDPTDHRYLLSASADSSVAVYDSQRPTSRRRHESLFVVDRDHESGHKSAVSSAIWYPVDTGLFVTGSYDGHVSVWDTNTTQAVTSFKMPGKVYKTAMSSLATSHMLIAAGTEDVQLRLCDIASGAFAHTLSGHRDGVMAVEWSASSEWVLASGGCDGAIRFWDIRRAGCFRVLDQSQSQLGSRPPLLERSTANKVSTSKAFPGNPGLIPKGRAATVRKLSNGVYMKPSIGSKVSSKGTLRQRLHPGLLSSQDRATAHYGVVTALKATDDGMHLLSAGSDSRLRLWDVESGRNTLVNYETVRLQTTKPMQLATSQNASLAFVPCMATVKAFDMWSGKTAMTFRGHYENVSCCWFNHHDQELYTGGNDRQILVWSPYREISDEMDEDTTQDQDNWSD